jgi:hypothetical protein
MSTHSSFLELPIAPSSHSSSGSSSLSSLFAGDSHSSNTTDDTPPSSPTTKEPKAIKPMSFGLPRRVSLPKLQIQHKNDENEQASRLDGESSPKTPIQSAKRGIFLFSPLAHIQLQEDDVGYESDCEVGASSRPSHAKRFSRSKRNLSTIPARIRSVTAPALPKVGEESPPGGIDHAAPAILRPNRPLRIDLAAVPPYAIKPKASKAPIGLGLGLSPNHPFQIPRASTAPSPMSPSTCNVPIANLLPSRPFSPPSPHAIQDPRLRPTILLGSPSPIEMLPSRFSYFQKHNHPSLLPGFQLSSYSSPNDAILEPPLSSVVPGVPSPMEVYSSFAYDSVYPRTPCASPEIHACPPFGVSEVGSGRGQVQSFAAIMQGLGSNGGDQTSAPQIKIA